MRKPAFVSQIRKMWSSGPGEDATPADILFLMLMGLLVGLLAGSIISVFRITSNWAYAFALDRTSGADGWVLLAWALLALLAALAVGCLVRNPAIRFGGAGWERIALENGQPRVWLRVLVPKFAGSWLVMAFGLSVGREGPSIQMGAAAALGVENLDAGYRLERRFFILGGCAAGIAAAFSAPFVGICYVFEIMREKISRLLLIFLLAGGFGVYLSCTVCFGLDVLVPLGPVSVPNFSLFWQFALLGVLSGAVGAAYNYMLRLSIGAYRKQKILSPVFRPLLPFCAAAVMMPLFPAFTGEGLPVIHYMLDGHALLGYLLLFLCVKLVFTAFCYGSGVPAGVMVPALCLGAVTGGAFFGIMSALGLLEAEYLRTCLVMGMAGAFSAAERAPVTGMMLVAEMTGAFACAPLMLLCAGVAAFTGRVLRVKAI